MNLQTHRKSRKNVNWNQKWTKKQLNILRNVVRLYSCGPPKVPTCRTSEEKKWVSSFRMMERGLYTAYSRIRSIDGHGSEGKKSPPNKQFIPHHLSRGKKIVRRTEKLAKLFFSRESQNYIFSVWFVGVSLFFVCCCCVCWTAEIPEAMNVSWS